MEIPYRIDVENGIIHGVLTRPDCFYAEPSPLVVMCAGFQANRIVENKFFVKMARKLMENGIASLRFDFLGYGVSSGESHFYTYQDKIRQLDAVMKRISGEPGIDRKRIGLVGFSEGCRLIVDYLLENQPSEWKPAIAFWSPSLLDPDPENDPRVAKGKKANNDLKRTRLDKKFALDMYGSWTHPRYFNYDIKDRNYIDKLVQIKDGLDILYIFGENDNLIGDTVPELRRRLTDEEIPLFHVIPNAGHLYELEPHRETVIDISTRFFAGRWEKADKPAAALRQVVIPVRNGHLFSVMHEPVHEGKGEVFLFLHGYGMFKEEHLNLYHRMGQYFSARGYNAVLFDYRGCGDSSGDLLDVTIRSMYEDVKTMIAYLNETYPGLRISLVAKGISVPLATQLSREVSIHRMICIGSAGTYSPPFDIPGTEEWWTGHDFLHENAAQTEQRTKWLNQLGCVPFFISAEKINRKFVEEVTRHANKPIEPKLTGTALWFYGTHSIRDESFTSVTWHPLNVDMETNAPRFNPTNHAGIGDEIIGVSLEWLEGNYPMSGGRDEQRAS